MNFKITIVFTVLTASLLLLGFCSAAAFSEHELLLLKNGHRAKTIALAKMKLEAPLMFSYVQSDRKMTDELLSNGSDEVVRNMVNNFSLIDIISLYEKMINYESRLKLITPENFKIFRTTVICSDDTEALNLILSYQNPTVDELTGYKSRFGSCMKEKCAALIEERISSL